MKYNKKVYLLLTVLFCGLIFTGCWDRRELTDLAIVGAIAIDKIGDKVNLSYEIIKAKSQDTKGSDEPPVYYLQSEGETISDSIKNATVKSDKVLFWPHTNMIYFSEKFAKDGLFSYIDYFNRNHEARRYVNLAVTKTNNAYEILTVDGINDIPSLYTEKLFENYSLNGKSVSVKLLDFLKTYYAEGIEPVTGIIEPKKRIEGKSEKKESKDGEEENLVPFIEGLAVFKEDKFIGFFDGYEARGYNIIVNKLKNSLVVSMSPDGTGKTSVEIDSSSSKIDVEIKDEKYYATLEIEINGVLGGEGGKEDISNLEAIKKIEEKTSEVIKNEVEKSIQKAKEYKSDIFGFGKALHISNPKKWKKIKEKWNDEFVNISINTIVKTKIKRVGVENQQLAAKESR
jgi:spore germination protein KC